MSGWSRSGPHGRNRKWGGLAIREALRQDCREYWMWGSKGSIEPAENFKPDPKCHSCGNQARGSTNNPLGCGCRWIYPALALHRTARSHLNVVPTPLLPREPLYRRIFPRGRRSQHRKTILMRFSFLFLSLPAACNERAICRPPPMDLTRSFEFARRRVRGFIPCIAPVLPPWGVLMANRIPEHPQSNVGVYRLWHPDPGCRYAASSRQLNAARPPTRTKIFEVSLLGEQLGNILQHSIMSTMLLWIMSGLRTSGIFRTFYSGPLNENVQFRTKATRYLLASYPAFMPQRPLAQ